ncbi:MAG: transposase [Planctomycetia bacterium]|nr:transposase [Planctomycetia bacterium]
MREFLSHTKIRLHFLPTYSPNLNPIERLWRFFKKKVLYNRYIPEFSKFMQECKIFFCRRKRYHAELRTLINEKFHLVADKN